MATKRLGARKERGTLKMVPPVSELESSIPSHVRRRAAKIHIHPALVRENDGVPYRSANVTEGELWEDDWCSKCKHDSNERNPCTIKMDAISGDVPEAVPEWFWFGGRPLCKAFDYTQETLEQDWKSHISTIAYGTTTVDYEPMQFTGEVNELVNNSMMSHWCHACHKKDTCTGYRDLVQDKSNIPTYWVWLKKSPGCIRFLPKVITPTVASQGIPIQPANTYRGYTYWVEAIPNSSMYAGFYQMVGAKQPERLSHDQVSTVMASMMLRDVIDDVASAPYVGNGTPGQWVKNYLQHFASTPEKETAKAIKAKKVKASKS